DLPDARHHDRPTVALVVGRGVRLARLGHERVDPWDHLLTERIGRSDPACSSVSAARRETEDHDPCEELPHVRPPRIMIDVRSIPLPPPGPGVLPVPSRLK